MCASLHHFSPFDDSFFTQLLFSQEVLQGVADKQEVFHACWKRKLFDVVVDISWVVLPQSVPYANPTQPRQCTKS